MNFIKKNGIGILLCLAIAIPSWFLGKIFPVVGGAVIAIIAGMIITMFWNDKKNAEAGIKWTSTIILQTAVVFWIWNESRSNLSDRKAIAADHYLYYHNISCYCVDIEESFKSTCKYINTCRCWLFNLRRLCYCSNCTYY